MQYEAHDQTVLLSEHDDMMGKVVWEHREGRLKRKKKNIMDKVYKIKIHTRFILSYVMKF